MKQLLYILCIVAIGLTSCSDFLDVNDDPTKIREERASLSVLMPTLCESTSSSYASASNTAMNVTHHLDNVQAGYYQEFTMSGAWSEIYLKGIPLAQTIADRADVEESPHYKGIAKVLEAVNLALLTDTWENVAYTEANQEGANTKPNFDKQEDVYTDIISLLDEGIEALGADESRFKPGNDDLIYQGDLTKWTKLAHSLKARNYLHLMKQGKATAQDVLDAVALGFESSDDNYVQYYTQNNANPFFSSISKRLNESIYTKVFAKFFVDYMNGTTYDVVDPRLPYIGTLEEGDSTYVGLESWQTDQVYSVLPRDVNYSMMVESSLIIMSYAELKFIEAEVSLTSGLGDAEAAYNAGIRANFADINAEFESNPIDEATITDYLNHSDVAVVDLEHIMKEKYIATLYNYEAWNDMRRHGFSSDIYKGFVEPDLNGRSVPAYRAEYPTFEFSRHEAVVTANAKDLTEKMWKDQ